MPTKPRLLIGCSGSVASVKIPDLVSELSDRFDVLVVATKNSLHFLSKSKEYNPEAWDRFEKVGGNSLVLVDEDEWRSWNKLGDPVVHIELRKWADILLIAPASANLIASASIGSCDNLLLSVIRAWDFNKPCILCPAMNTVMWDHPATETALSILRGWGWRIVGPVEKLLACNERGNGAMSSVSDIARYLQELEVLIDRSQDTGDGIKQMLSKRCFKCESEVQDKCLRRSNWSSNKSYNWSKIAMYVSLGIIVGVSLEAVIRRKG